jgi:glucosamine--fructose-6-phosphate aminotransferase (isomerizing)
MCGIIGYIGKKDARPILIAGLKNLEYRGYDSTGIATVHKNSLHIARSKGKIKKLEKKLSHQSLPGTIGLGHNRWATHGLPSEENAHPHIDCKKNLVIVHNGIIENHIPLREKLQKEGHVFGSDTDTEVMVHLIEKYLRLGLEGALARALKQITGSYAIGLISRRQPGVLLAARQGSPLIIGLGREENFIASDIPAILHLTKRVIYLQDGEMAVLTSSHAVIKNLSGKIRVRKAHEISWNPVSAQKAGFPHFMLKEICEQPRAIEDTFTGRISIQKGEVYLAETGLTRRELKNTERIVITACGTSWHAALIGKFMLEELARIPVEVDYAAEFRYRNPVLTPRTLVIGISQSGETADTLGAMREAKKHGAKVISICNVVGSSITRETGGTVYTRAGPEIGVASTKAFSSQLAVLYLFSLYLGKIRGEISSNRMRQYILQLKKIPSSIERILRRSPETESLAEIFHKKTNCLYLGRGEGYAVALEGALKLKEVSYIHAEGYPAAEMKHGPIALIDKNMPVVALALKGRRYDKILGNISEVKARSGIVIALASSGDKKIKEKVDYTFYIPRTNEMLSAILAVIPLQLLAYYTAVKRGCNVDQPRNLAKSVTVE